MAKELGAPWIDDLATISSLSDDGWSYDRVRRRIRTGSWQELLPRVVLRTTGEPTERQWWRAALLYAGPDSALSHATASGRWSLPVTSPRVVVTRPGGSHPRSTSRVWVRQSTRPFRVVPLDGFPTTSAARSVLDTCLDLRRLPEVDALMGRAVQRRLVTVDELADELVSAPSAGSRLPRLAMADLAAVRTLRPRRSCCDSSGGQPSHRPRSTRRSLRRRAPSTSMSCGAGSARAWRSTARPSTSGRSSGRPTSPGRTPSRVQASCCCASSPDGCGPSRTP